MSNKTISIFGAGASGLYAAWRLLNGKPVNKKKPAGNLEKGDVLRLYDWGKYNFSKKEPGTRAAGARVCTWHYQDDPGNSYLELGGMRYSFWNGEEDGEGHRLVTKTIADLGLDKYSVPFNESGNPLLYLRSRNMYLNQIDSNNRAPYDVNNYGAAAPPDDGFGITESVSITKENGPKNRKEWCDFYAHGKINIDLPESSAFQKGDYVKNIGYWNLMLDQLGSEGFNYVADGNGYSANVVNSNSAQSFQVNNEFTPGTEYKTLTTGFSALFNALFNEIVRRAKKIGVDFQYCADTRLHSILQINKEIHYTIATRQNPDRASGSGITDTAFLAMPRSAIELVAQATRYQQHKGVDVLNHEKVQLYLESAIMQPSYKIGMFFDNPWWLGTEKSSPTFPAQLEGYEVTRDTLKKLAKAGFPKRYVAEISANGDPEIMETPYDSKNAFFDAVETRIKHKLTYNEEQKLIETAARYTIGPSITDLPIRQVVYFGDNASNKKGQKVYGILASYDDENYTTFWKPLELGPKQQRKIPFSRDTQPLDGPRDATPAMVKTLRKQLAAMHFGPQADFSLVPAPLETKYMDWSLPPFNAGYHAYSAHYNICDVQASIRKPSQLVQGADANIFIIGETYSNDQAWVEGAFCTAESVLNDFLNIKPIISPRNYPFICGTGKRAPK